MDGRFGQGTQRAIEWDNGDSIGHLRQISQINFRKTVSRCQISDSSLNTALFRLIKRRIVMP
jgi:hypothetical protein